MHCSLNNVTLFFSVTEKHTIVYVGHIFLIHSSVDGHLGCFQNSFCIVYSVYCATVNIDIQGSLCVFYWNPLGKMSQSDIPGLHVKSMPILFWQLHNS